MYGWTHRIYGTLVMLITFFFRWPAALSMYFLTHHGWIATFYFATLFFPPIPVRYYGSKFMIPSFVSFMSTLPDLDRKWGDPRGWFHSLWGYLLVSGIFALAYFLICVYLFGTHPSLHFAFHALLFGLNISLPFLVHLVLDSLTYEGIEWIPPLWRTRVRGPLISGDHDIWFFFPAWIPSFYLTYRLWNMYYHFNSPVAMVFMMGLIVMIAYPIYYFSFGP